MKTVDYFLEALKHHGFCALYSSKHRLVEALKSTRHKQGRNDGFLTDQPIGIKLAEDDIIKVRYDVKTMRWIANRPSRIKYPTARELIKQYRCRRLVEAQRAMRSTTPSTSPREYAERLG